MHSPFIEVITNKIFLTTMLAWLVAQGIKIVAALILRRRFNFKLLLGTGGMPSAHAASVTALAVSVGKVAGFGSPVCILAMVFAYVTMFDAQGVRRSSGAQAATLNKIMQDIYSKKPIQPERMAELLGHTPVEVFAGSLLGMALAFFMFR